MLVGQIKKVKSHTHIRVHIHYGKKKITQEEAGNTETLSVRGISNKVWFVSFMITNHCPASTNCKIICY